METKRTTVKFFLSRLMTECIPNKTFTNLKKMLKKTTINFFKRTINNLALVSLYCIPPIQHVSVTPILTITIGNS